MATQQLIKSPQSAFNKFLDKGINAGAEESYDIARKWLNQAAKLGTNKEREICWFCIAHSFNNQDQFSEALRFARRAEQFSPQSSKIQRFIGHLQLELGRPKLAERALRKSIKKKPSAAANIFLGSALGKQGRFREEKSSYQSAVRLDPKNEEAHYNLGVKYKFKNQRSRAEKHFRRAIEIDPRYGLAYSELGSVLVHKGLYSQARSILLKVVKFSADNYWARLYLANANWHLRRLKDAEEQYRAVQKASPSDSLANACLGDFLSCEQRGSPEPYLKKLLPLTRIMRSFCTFWGNITIEIIATKRHNST